MNKTAGRGAKLYLIIITVLTYLPIILTIVYSFNESRISSVWSGFSLKWYRELWYNRDIQQGLWNSLVIAFLSCAISALIGTLGALSMHKTTNKLHSAAAWCATLPIMLPEIILGMVFLAVFALMRLPFGFVTLVIAHCTFCVPYIFITVRARLVGLDESLEEAALDLGASKLRVLCDIILPEIMPAVLSGGLLAFAMSFDDVIISIFVTGPSVNTLPVIIYTMLKTGVTPEVNALASLMLLFTCLIVLLAALIRRRTARGQADLFAIQ